MPTSKNKPPETGTTPWDTLKGGMLMTPRQHAALAEVYAKPRSDLSPQELQHRQMLAKHHAALSKWALRENLKASSQGPSASAKPSSRNGGPTNV
jgi:hypothetical protein